MILVGGKTYELVKEHKNAWNADAFKERYSEVLDRYDYIVGDWGYNQLRLKGFFREGNPKGNKESSIAGLQDYLQEYCNFGCAYFVLERAAGKASAGTGGEQELSNHHADVRSEELAEGDASLEPRGPAGVLAGGQPFSDRRPYSWREHQSPARLSGRAAAERKEAQGEADAGNKKSGPDRGGGAEPRIRGEDVTLHGGVQRHFDGKGREGNDGGDKVTIRGERNFGSGDGASDRGDKSHRGGGRRFHHKGPKQSAAHRGPHRSASFGKTPDGGHRAEGGVPEGRNRQQERNERQANRGRNHHVPPPQRRNPE